MNDGSLTALRVRIEEWGATIPEPSSQFRFKVMVELEHARLRVEEILGHPRRGRPLGRTARRSTPERRVGRPFTTKRGCVGCGGHLDDLNAGCTNCVERHAMRRRENERRAAA